MVLDAASMWQLDVQRVRRLHVEVDCRDSWRPTCRATAKLLGGGELWALGRGEAIEEATSSALRQLRDHQPNPSRILGWAGSFALMVVTVALAVVVLT